jgi:isochorismate pyruvate lyase
MSSLTHVAIDPRPAPEDCQTMLDVRQGVDAIDRALVRLIAERQGYMDAAARIKPDRDAVHDEARIEQVVSKVKAQATAAGLSHAIAEPVWRAMIARCIAYEYEVWDRVHAQVDVRRD